MFPFSSVPGFELAQHEKDIFDRQINGYIAQINENEANEALKTHAIAGLTQLLSAIHRAKEPKKASLKALFRVVVRKTHGPAKPALERIWVHYTVYTFTDNMDHAYMFHFYKGRIA
ncbi:hypothetical protein B0H11DRAFT_1929616 [Mycena galericulata]|nr:hypothetical protein B0H11DRAFT_1929616 [Mycena galericulata]